MAVMEEITDQERVANWVRSCRASATAEQPALAVLDFSLHYMKSAGYGLPARIEQEVRKQLTEGDKPHVCDLGERYALYDARGIFCCYVCQICVEEKRERYRPGVLDDALYDHDEPIDDE